MKIFRHIIFIMVICLALIIEATFFSSLKLLGATPDLVLVTVISVSFFISDRTSMIYAGVAGLLEDLYVGSMLGSNFLIIMIAVYFVKTYSSRVIREIIITPLIIIFICSIFYYFLMAAVLFIAGSGYLLNLEYLQAMISGSIYNLLAALVIYPLSYLAFHNYKGEY